MTHNEIPSNSWLFPTWLQLKKRSGGGKNHTLVFFLSPRKFDGRQREFIQFSFSSFQMKVNSEIISGVKFVTPVEWLCTGWGRQAIWQDWWKWRPENKWSRSMPRRPERQIYDTKCPDLLAVARSAADSQWWTTSIVPRRTKWSEISSSDHRWRRDRHCVPMRVLRRWGTSVVNDIYARCSAEVSLSKRCRPRINRSVNAVDVDNHRDDWHLNSPLQVDKDSHRHLPMPIMMIGRMRRIPRKRVAASINKELKSICWSHSVVVLLVFIRTRTVFLLNCKRDSQSVYSSIKRERKLPYWGVSFWKSRLHFDVLDPSLIERKKIEGLALVNKVRCSLPSCSMRSALNLPNRASKRAIAVRRVDPTRSHRENSSTRLDFVCSESSAGTVWRRPVRRRSMFD